MASVAEMRAWLKAEGFEPGVKGALKPEHVAAFEDAHPPEGGPDYPDADFETAFPVVPAELDGGAARPKETPPRRSKADRPGMAFPNPFGNKGTRRKRPRARHARVGTEDLISGAWGVVSRFTRPVPPVSRILAIQAPVAGVLLEPAVKGTAVDRLLQPLARIEQQGKLAGGLIGPPLIVGAITWHLQQCANANPPTEPNPVFMAAATEMLRESLLLYADVAGPKFAEAAERVQRREAQLGGPVDDLMAFLFSQPPMPNDDDAVAAEDEAIRRAQGLLADEAEPPQWTGD